MIIIDIWSDCRTQSRKSKESSIGDVIVRRNHVNQKKALFLGLSWRKKSNH